MAEHVTPTPLRVQAHGLQAMAAYIESVRGQPHVWGTRDCWTFVRDGVRALADDATFGGDIAPYDSALGAARAFANAFSSRSLTAYAEPWHIRPVLYSRFAFVASGSILVWHTPGDVLPHFGLVLGRTLWECTEEGGVAGTPLARCLARAEAFDEGLTIYCVAVA